MVDYRTRATRDNVDQLRAEFGSDVFGVEIRTNIRLAEAPSVGQTIFEYDPASTGADAYYLMAEEYLLRTRDLYSETDGTEFAASAGG
jgi:chromosome partitioning protein